MPNKKKNKFIDKKNAVTFHLVHRSQRDPLVADENAPQHVLVQPDANVGDASSRREDQIKYGIYYEDDYNYLQHLRDVDELQDVGIVDSFRIGDSASHALVAPSSSARKYVENESMLVEVGGLTKKDNKLSLPSTVFGSTVETDVGLLNRAAPLVGPQLDFDPDIVAAMDEDFDFEDADNMLDDDFITIANADGDGMSGGEEDEGEDVDSNAADDSEDEDEMGSLGELSFSGEETKSRFTDYSMSSSVMKRNAGLSLLDDRFEKFYEQYGEEEMGALDGEEIAGTEGQGSALLQRVLDDFERETKVIPMKDVIKKGVRFHDDDYESSDSGGELEKVEVEVGGRQFDCESILSTHSTLYNHPKTIPLPSKKSKKIELTKRAEIPADVLPSRGPTRRQLEEQEESETRERVEVPQRVRGETAEERRARKQTVKEGRRHRREEKAATRQAFKDEKLRLDKEVLNVKQNLQSVRIV